jgi:hypothetical protein
MAFSLPNADLVRRPVSPGERAKKGAVHNEKNSGVSLPAAGRPLPGMVNHALGTR